MSQHDEFDGIVVTHGSDTVSYTTAVLSYVFSGINKPIITVCSNYPLDDERTNGIDNFEVALKIIREKKMKGVFSVNCVENKKNIFLGTRMLEADYLLDTFRSSNGTPYANVIGDRIIINGENINYHKSLISDIEFNNKILAYKNYVGMDYNAIDLNSVKPKAIMHFLYHSATGCIVGGGENLIRFIDRSKNLGIDNYFISFKKDTRKLYVTTKAIIDAGCIALENISYMACLTKMHVAYNQNDIPPIDYMTMPIAGEFIRNH